MTAPQTTSASYEVGYRKPPRHKQFHKGQSGNPGGRPRQLLAKRLEELALYEAYRMTIVMENGHAMPMPAIQAVLRRQLRSAADGNVRAQRDILAMIQHIERIRSIFGTGGADDVVVDDDDVVDTDDADANDDNDVDDTADADRDDADDDDEPARQQADVIDTYGERRQEERGVLKGEGRTAKGSPGWGDGRATDDSDAEFAEPLSPPPGPLTRADLPPPGGGEEAWKRTAPPPAVSAPQPENAAALPAGRTVARARLSSPSPLVGEGRGGGSGGYGTIVPQSSTPTPDPSPAEPRYSEGSATQQNDRSRQQPTSVGGGEQKERAGTPSLPSGSESGQRRGVLPRRNGPGRSAGIRPARPQPGRRRRSAAVNAGKIPGGHSGSSRRSPRRTTSGPRPAQAAGGHARAPATPAERDEN